MNSKDLWTGVVTKLAENIDRNQIITWFKNTAVLANKEGVLTVGLPLPVFLNWHATHLSKATLKAAQIFDPSIQTIAYEVNMHLGNTDVRAIDISKHFSEKSPRKLPNKNEVKLKEGVISRVLNARYTLENFIVSPENRLAHAACENVAKYPGRHYNPLFVYGDVGLGKTHLLQATGNEILRHDPRKVVVYSTSEMFANEFIECVRTKNMNRLRGKYRKVDVLLIDDIQFLANKDRTEEEFFHTFNALYDMGRQIVISSDRPLQELKLLSPRLLSRLESGMMVDVKMPDYETRMAILQSKCQEASVMINQDVLEFIAFNATRSIRALEGVLTQAIAKHQLEHVTPTVQMASEILRHTQKEVKMVGFIENDPTPRGAITLDLLVACVAEYFSIPKTDVIGASRVRECMIPRQVIMYLAKTKLNMSLVRIGRELGNRNHTTVMHAVNKLKDLLKNDRQLLRDVNAIKREVGIQ